MKRCLILGMIFCFLATPAFADDRVFLENMRLPAKMEVTNTVSL